MIDNCQVRETHLSKPRFSKPLLSHPLTLITAIVFILAATFSVSGFAQFDPANQSGSAAPLASAPSNTAEYPQNPIAKQWGSTLFADQQPQTFLPVEEAYRLSAQKQANGKLLISWDIEPGYYLYKHQIKISWPGTQPSIPQLPEGRIKYDEIFEKELEVYYDLLEFEIDHEGQASSLKVHSQGCADAGLCYPPQTQQLEISASEITLVPSASPLPNAPDTNSKRTNDGGPLQFNSLTLIGSLIGALLGGLILNLMPCVFPVLSLKALHLLQSHQSPQRQHLHGWAYTAGCVITFCLIAAAMFSLREAGQLIGWGFQLQSPWVVAALSYLFITMGILLLGDFAIGGSLTNSGQQLTEHNGYSASFFTGALATVVASPCTAPFMGAALGYAISQPTAIGLSIFAALGFGMALPFLLLSYIPALGEKLPKPGPWMNTLKQFFAFPLFFTALWLLWVLSKQSGSDALIAFIGGALCIAMGLWLWQSSPSSSVKKILAIAIATLSLTPFFWDHADNLQSEADNHAQVLSNGWQPFSQQRLDQLLARETPVFVNMTAAWCITCLANEKVALNTQATTEAFDHAGVVKLKGDWTNYNPEITQLLNRYGRNGVPLYLLYSGKNLEQPLILPQLLTESTIKEALERLNSRS